MNIDQMNAETMYAHLSVLGRVQISSMVGLADIDSPRWRAKVDGTEVTDGTFLTSISGHGDTPREALTELFRMCISSLRSNERIVTGAYRRDRREWRWDGERFACVQ